MGILEPLLEPFLAGANQPHLCEGYGQRVKGIFLFVKWRVPDLCGNLNFRFGGIAVYQLNGRFWAG